MSSFPWQTVPGMRFLVIGTRMPDVRKVSVEKSKWQPVKCQVSLDDTARNYAPFNTASPYYGMLRPNVWASGVPSRIAQVQMMVGGEAWTSPDGIMLEYDYHASPDGYEVGSSTIDFTHLLLRDNQSMQPWRSTPSR